MDFIKIFFDGFVFYALILGLFVLGLGREFSFSPTKKKQDAAYKDLENRIEFLGKLGKFQPITDKKNYDLAWAREHLEGKEKENSFLPARNSLGQFILLQYPQILAVIPRSSLRFIPSILTAIGVLGTFWGITIGIQGVNITPEDTQKSLESAINLLQGMGTAFITSLAGLGSSTVFTFVLAFSDQKKRDRCYELRRKLDKVAVLETPERIFSRIDFSPTAAAAESLANVASLLETQFKPEAIGEAVGRQIGIVFNQVVQDSLAPVFLNIERSQQRLEVITSDQREVLTNLIHNMATELIEPVTKRLDRSAAMIEDASTAIRTLNQDLGGITTKLSSAVVTIQDFQQQTVVQLQEFAESLRETLTQFQTDTKDVLQETAKEIRTGTVEILEKAQQTFQEQSNILSSVGSEASGLMTSAKVALIDSLSEIDHRLENMSEATQSQLEQFRVAYQNNLTEFFTQQNNLLEETLGEQRNRLAEVVENLNNIFQEEYERRSQLSQDVERSMNSIRITAQEVGKLATAIGLTSSQRVQQLEEISREVIQQVERIEQSNRSLSEGYRNSLSSWQEYINQLVNEKTEFFKEADTAMAKVSSGLLEAANILIQVDRVDRDKF